MLKNSQILKELVVFLIFIQAFKLTNQQECGTQKVYPLLNRIINGDNVIPNSWPWMASVRYYVFDEYLSQHFCGGTLINSEYILTAAHCVSAFDNKYAVVLGDNKTYQVSVKVYNKDYSQDNPQLGNDIGLLKLNTPVQFSEYISPICVPGINGDIFNIMYRTVVTAGWLDCFKFYV